MWKHIRTCVCGLRKVPLGRVSDALDVLGIGCLVGAAYWWLPIVGLVATGVALLFFGWVTHESD
jgi:hypothetical protein